MRVMVLEDDSTISFAIKTFLQRHSIEAIVFNDIGSTKNVVVKDFDLIILDINLPDGSGFDYLRWVRESFDIPIIMLTVKDEEEYVLKGFSEGADEYITKPFSLPILKARIDNIFKRRESNVKEMVFGDLYLDVLSKTARISNRNLELNKQEFAVLEILLENKNCYVSRERIIDSVWGYDLYEINDNTLTVTVKRLRNKIGKYSEYLKTVRGIGYTWEGKEI